MQTLMIYIVLIKTDRRPAYFPALARLVEVMRRTGTLDETNPYLDRAEQATLKPYMDSGFNFCKGLYEWYYSEFAENLSISIFQTFCQN